jgi:thiol-disulfide isomerase/thioredoxin
LPILVILVAVVGGLSLVKKQAVHSHGAQAQVQEGTVLTDFNLNRFQGKDAPVSAQPGKVFLINFWASWCEACMTEMPSIVKLWSEYHAQGFEVLAVNVDENPAAVIPGISKKLHMDFPIFVDKDQALGDLFDIRAIPTSIIIDKNRKVLFVDTGERDWDGKEVRDQLKQWLSAT